MKYLAKIALAALLVGAVGSGQPRAAAQDPKPAAKNIDLCICLDISGSMNGLVDSARAKLWDIVNELARIQPAPNLRVALYSYGGTAKNGYSADLGWVRRELDLTTDLDALYQKLFALKIGGGLEYVTRVCRDAVEQQPWSQDKDALKIIFVCGNEPASQDKVVSLKEAADKAKAKNIIINPIFCGPAQHRDARDWIEFTKLTGGRFASIDQNRGAVPVVATPMDKKLVELGAQMNGTYVTYGKKGESKAQNQLAQDANAAKGGAYVAASRIVTKNSALYRCDDWDLVDRIKHDPKFDVTKVPEAELSEALRKLTPEQRVAHVKEMAAKRESLQKQIDELTVQRNAHIQKELKRQQGQTTQVFDAALRETLRLQAATRGIKIPD
ncbi:MAG TPA: vWA domain-containing protein [Gemmataceae bacterium]|nr:vWA domain-containing protein [Gemmataceae bacterium]